jgi:D-aminopeptidase
MTKKILASAVVLLFTAATATQNATPDARPCVSDFGLKVGMLPTVPLDAITNVAGIEVGHTTIIRGDDVHTGVTAVLPHPGNLFAKRCRVRFL